MRELQYPFIDHASYWALRIRPGSKGPARWTERVMVSYAYTFNYPNLEERVQRIQQAVADFGYTMSRRAVFYGGEEAHEVIIAAQCHMLVVSDLIRKKNQKSGVSKRKVRYIDE